MEGMSDTSSGKFPTADRLNNVTYELRGPLSVKANKMIRDGEKVLKLNTGNPASFGFTVPEDVLSYLEPRLDTSHAYTDSRGTIEAREAVVKRYESDPDFPAFDVDDIFLGNGVSELIQMTTQAMINRGDEVLVPSPDYPLWSAAVTMSGGTAVHYRCIEEDGWNPDVADMASKITDKTKAIVVINPNNPTGAVYTRETLEQIADLARKHNLIICADEIYDRITYDNTPTYSMASIAPDVLTLTYNGLSKAYRVCGYRSGWMVITGPTDEAKGFIAGMELLAGMRLCPNYPGQQALIGALGGKQDIFDLTSDGRLAEQRNVTYDKLNAIDAIDVVKPMGALYAFPRINPDMIEIHDDAKLMMDILEQEKILLVGGNGFNWETPGYFRVVMLPSADDLSEAIERLGNFLSSYRQ